MASNLHSWMDRKVPDSQFEQQRGTTPTPLPDRAHAASLKIPTRPMAGAPAKGIDPFDTDYEGSTTAPTAAQIQAHDNHPPNYAIPHRATPEPRNDMYQYGVREESAEILPESSDVEEVGDPEDSQKVRMDSLFMAAKQAKDEAEAQRQGWASSYPPSTPGPADAEHIAVENVEAPLVVEPVTEANMGYNTQYAGPHAIDGTQNKAPFASRPRAARRFPTTFAPQPRTLQPEIQRPSTTPVVRQHVAPVALPSNSRKRDRSPAAQLDYTPAELDKMTYEELQTQKFDYDPNPPQLDDYDASQPLPMRMKAFMKRPEDDKRKFFVSLSADEQKEAEAWFMDQFRGIEDKFSGIREMRRKQTEKLEGDMKARHDQVVARKELIDEELVRIRTQGQGVLRSPSRRPNN
ncbi:hypothetical protein EJ06DRAFT_527059 [Trichodelitschia bisporula]|uniref:Extracellular mutant protein 11 C-terminal domain-containing protein n=1 Tax=Trichodelitschia bisporula TaxID=703511 RepID=A0A6G1I5U5_9PEZI|nr:hypothetical protein EJ06DRAFT_527059 [Trichodelitschia bisporula]